MSLDLSQGFLRRLIAPSDVFNWPIFGNDREITGIPFMWDNGRFFLFDLEMPWRCHRADNRSPDYSPAP